MNSVVFGSEFYPASSKDGTRGFGKGWNAGFQSRMEREDAFKTTVLTEAR